jgi:hypothetical protein
VLPVSRWQCTRFRRFTKNMDAIGHRVDDIDLPGTHLLLLDRSLDQVNVLRSTAANETALCTSFLTMDCGRCENDAHAEGYGLP